VTNTHTQQKITATRIIGGMDTMKESTLPQWQTQRRPVPEIPRQILLVTPVWNDSTRLAEFGASLARALADSPLPIHWLIADDGSGPAEHTRLNELRARFARVFPYVGLHFAKEHQGKGSVIREAWALAPDAEWLAFVDADGSVSAADVLALIERALDSGSTVLGIRKRTATTRIVESPWRAVFHRGFLLAARLLLGLRCEDPQCGVKVLKAADYRSIEYRLEETGFAFDSELLATLDRGGADWIEVPVTWTEKKGGKVNPIRDGWAMLLALLRIRDRAW
jgi:dolichyl-phosphate beta-glucosyltransferase